MAYDVEPQPHEHNRTVLHPVENMLDRQDKKKHDACPQHREDGDELFGNAQILGDVKPEKVCGDHGVDVVEDHKNDNEHHGGGVDHFFQDVFVADEKPEYGSIFGFGHSLVALLRFSSLHKQDDKFCRHGDEGEKVNPPHGGHHGKLLNQQGGNRRKENGDQAGHLYPGEDVDHEARFAVLHEKAGPGYIGNLEQAVADCGCQKPPKILSERPNQAGERPGNGVKDDGGHPPAELVGNHAAEKGGNNLEAHPNGEDKANLGIVDAKSVHVKSCERGEQVVGDVPERFGKKADTRVAFDFK